MKKITAPGNRTVNKEAVRSTKSNASDFFATPNSATRRRGVGIKEFCASYGVTRDVFTRLAGFSPRAVAHWARGREPSASTARRLTELNRVFEALGRMVSSPAIGPWLREPNPAFDGSTPLQVIERGEMDRIWRMIYELQSGEPG